MTEASARPTVLAHDRAPPPGWLAPAGLILLSLVPVVGGALPPHRARGRRRSSPRTTRGSSPRRSRSSRTSSAPPCYCCSARSSSCRRCAGGRWHRVAGRILVPAGLLAALSGLWMALFSASPAPTGRRSSSSAWCSAPRWSRASCSASSRSAAATSRTHSAWMTRAYAIGIGAGTQVFTCLAWILLIGAPGADDAAVLMGAGWVINLAVAEVVIRRRVTARGAVLAFRPIRPCRELAYHEGHDGPLRSLWDAPAASPPPPRRVWRDWVLVAVLPLLARARGGCSHRCAVALALGRRAHRARADPALASHPAAAHARDRVRRRRSVFAVATGGDPQLVTTAYMLLLVYAAFRWGTGRAMHGRLRRSCSRLATLSLAFGAAALERPHRRLRRARRHRRARRGSSACGPASRPASSTA